MGLSLNSLSFANFMRFNDTKLMDHNASSRATGARRQRKAPQAPKAAIDRSYMNRNITTLRCTTAQPPQRASGWRSPLRTMLRDVNPQPSSRQQARSLVGAFFTRPGARRASRCRDCCNPRDGSTPSGRNPRSSFRGSNSMLPFSYSTRDSGTQSSP
jgi:hypothetical protein